MRIVVDEQLSIPSCPDPKLSKRAEENFILQIVGGNSYTTTDPSAPLRQTQGSAPVPVPPMNHFTHMFSLGVASRDNGVGYEQAKLQLDGGCSEESSSRYPSSTTSLCSHRGELCRNWKWYTRREPGSAKDSRKVTEIHTGKSGNRVSVLQSRATTCFRAYNDTTSWDDVL